MFFSVPPPEVLAFRSTPTAAWETIQLTDIHRPDRQVISLRGAQNEGNQPFQSDVQGGHDIANPDLMKFELRVSIHLL